MSDNSDLHEFQRLLKELRAALDRSDSKYTHLVVDKQFVDNLVKEGEEIAKGYVDGLRDTERLEMTAKRADELEAGASRFVGVDPTFVS